MSSEAMKNELKAVGHGYTANCWCTHGCWIMSSMNFNPRKMVSMLIKANGETKRLAKQYPVAVDEAALRALEDKYRLDRKKLQEIGLVDKSLGTA